MLNSGQTSLKILKFGHFSTFCMKGLTHFGRILQFFFQFCLVHHLLQNTEKHFKKWGHWHQIDRINLKLSAVFLARTL